MATWQTEKTRLNRLRKRLRVFEADGFTCVYCGLLGDATTLEIDHVVPVSRGGSRLDVLNMVTSCRKCNNLKSGFTPYEAGMWLRFGRFYPPLNVASNGVNISVRIECG